MDPITVIVTALVAGAAAGGTDAASAAVRDAYSALRRRVHRNASDSDTARAVEANERVPGSNIAEIESALAQSGLNEDPELRAAAEALLSQLPIDRVTDAQSRIDLSRAQGVQVGDNNTQNNSFG